MFGKNVPACSVWVRSSFQFLKVSPLSSNISLVWSSYDNPVQSGQSWPVWWSNIHDQHWNGYEGGRKHCWSMLFLLCCEAKVVDDLSVNVCCFLCHLTLLTILARPVLARRHGHYHDHSVKAHRSYCSHSLCQLPKT